MLRHLIFPILLSLMPSLAVSETVTASWYEMGHTTANGESYDPMGMTIAHRTLPFNTIVLLERNGRYVVARVNDRGPFIHGRQVDMSRGVAERLHCIERGICRVDMIVLDRS